MPYAEFEQLSEPVDISKYPKNIQEVVGDQQVTLGDLHGNSLKLLFTLIKHGFVEGISKEDYEWGAELYHHSALEPDEYPNSNELNKFNRIIAKMRLKPEAAGAKLRLLGDELADRGANDYFTLKILQQLKKQGVNYEIIYSNHSFTFLAAYEQYKVKSDEINADQTLTEQEKKEHKLEAFTKATAQCRPTPSFDNLQALISDMPEMMDEIESIVESAYMPSFKLVTYTLNSTKDEITLGSHAPIDVAVIARAAAELGVEFSDETATDLAKSIDSMNEAFEQLIKAQKVMSTVYPKSERGQPRIVTALHDIMWNRDYTLLNRSAEHKGYSVNYMHGHDSGGPNANNVANLDNQLGKRKGYYQGTYTALVRTDQHLLATMRQAQVIDSDKEPVNVLGMSFPVALVAGYNQGRSLLESFEFKASIMTDQAKNMRDIEYELRRGYRENMGHEYIDKSRDAAQQERAQLTHLLFSEPAEDKPQYVIYRDWRFPADLIDVYNFGRDEMSQFQLRNMSKGDSYESLYQELVDEYQAKMGDKLGLKAKYDGKPDVKYRDWHFPADLVEVYNIGRQELEKFEHRNHLRGDTYQDLYKMLVDNYQSALGRDYPGLREPDVLIGNWQFPADLVAVYNQSQESWLQFERETRAVDETYQSLFEKLVEGYNNNAENNYVGQLASSHSARQASLFTDSPLGIPVLAEATAPLDIADRLDELRPQLAAYQTDAGVPFESHLASNQERIEWQREKEQGQRVPRILRQVYNWAKEMGQELERGLNSGFGLNTNDVKLHDGRSPSKYHNYGDSEAFQQSVDAVRAQMPIFSGARYHQKSNEVELFLWPGKSFENAPCYARATKLGCRVVESSSGKGTAVRFSKEAFDRFIQPLLLKDATNDNRKGLTERAPERARRVCFADEKQSAIDINPEALDEMAAVRNKKSSS